MTSMAASAGVLGGSRAVGARPKTAADWQAVIEEGIPVGSAEALKRAIAVPDRELAALLGISEKTLSRGRAAGGRVQPGGGERVCRAARLGAAPPRGLCG